ncbi:MAG TPA: hypothetical protein VH061_06010 [Solirubrobacteraceae bacterium]|jgi:hypothetical protein|nr:hypothetical protein [Solirubrobacteraceae bacterium]
MPTFCRHGRFLERCPICSKTLPGNEPAGGAPRRARSGGTAARRQGAGGARRTREGLRVRHEGRAVEDGYSSPLVPGLRASADAARLAEEIAFSSGRLAALASGPPGLYGEARSLMGSDLERATWICFLLAYLCPTEDGQPFASVQAVLDVAPGPGSLPDELGGLLDGLAMGPRGSHEQGSGARTLEAYAQWLIRAGGPEEPQARAFTGDLGWTPERRFARLSERLALPGLSRAARYELLVSLGHLGLYELASDSLQLSSARATGGEDPTTVAAKRIFGIGDPLLLDRRAAALAEAAGEPIEALDLAFANWAGPARATLGIAAETTVEVAPIAAALSL